MSSFPDSFDSTRPFEDEDSGYTPPPYSDFADDSAIFNSISNNGDGVFAPNPIYGFDSNGDPEEIGVFVESDGPILPPPSQMQEEGLALREWRRQNAVLLEQKEKREKEILSQIIEEANEYKASFHEKRKVTCENNKSNNREKEKLFLANQEKFHKEVDKNYWKAIAELIPNEVPAIEKKRGKKEQEKKPSIVVIQGPKPGKPTDLARMRQILVKLKHTTPAHLKLTPPAAKDDNAAGSAAEPSKPALASAPQAVVAA